MARHAPLTLVMYVAVSQVHAWTACGSFDICCHCTSQPDNAVCHDFIQRGCAVHIWVA